MRLMLSIAILTAGCATRIGARSLPEVRAAYNEAVAESSSEQMLLNLVRLRYNHTMQFLEPVSVVTTYSFNRNLSVSGSGNINGENSFASIAGGGLVGGLSATESPTITYTPLSGEEFVRRLASPLPPDLVLLLLQGGWPADRLLPYTISRIGPATAPIIAASDETSRFTRIVSDLTTLQADGTVQVDIDPASGGQLGLDDSPVAARLLADLGLPPETRRVGLTSRLLDIAPTDVPFITRSMNDTLFYLSHGVDVRREDAAARDLGVPLPVVDPLLHVQSGPQPPGTAYVAVPYRGRWYWIDDTDRSSKRVFGAIATLFMIMSAPTEVQAPVLTLPR